MFCMVANAQQSVLAGLDSQDKTRVHGVSLDIPARTQLRRMLAVLPKVKRVGVLYDPKKSAATVAEMKQAAAELGLEVVGQEIDAQSSLPEATALIVSRIDLLWAPVDSTVFNSRSAQFVLTQMLQSKVPVMGFSENMVKAGALLAPRVNYEAVGRQTAEFLRRVLNPNGQLGEPVQAPQEFQIVVNGRVLELLGNPIPQAAIGQVSVINNEE
jgi:putative ABC transport system substrate-binding protein